MRKTWITPPALMAALLAVGPAAVEASPEPTDGPASSSQIQPLVPAAPVTHAWLDVNGKPLPWQSDAEVEEFLRTARIVGSDKPKHGKYGVRRLEMEMGDTTAHAACRTMAVEDRFRRLQDRDVPFFRDHYINEPAAYALSELLGFEMVPPAVRRTVRGKRASVQIWVEGVMVALERNERGLQPPDPQHYLKQLDQMRVFDNLINNIDRNMGNILIDPEWRIWLIDHSRSFMRHKALPAPEGVRRIESDVWERLQKVSDEDLEAAVKPFLGGPERAALLERRRLLVERIEEQIAELGEDAVVFSW